MPPPPAAKPRASDPPSRATNPTASGTRNASPKETVGRCRLTIHPPNRLASRLYKDALARCFADQSFCGRYWPMLCCGSIGGVTAFVILIVRDYDEDDGGDDGGSLNFGGFFNVLLIFGALGGLFQYVNRIDSMEHAVGDDGVNKARRFIDEALDARAEAAARPHRARLLDAYAEAAIDKPAESSENDDDDDEKEEGFAVGEILPYAGLYQAGCLPATLVVTYERAWASLGRRYRALADDDAGDGAAARDVVDLHERWVDLLGTAAAAGVAVTDAVTIQRAKAKKMAARQALGNALDAGGSIAGLAGLSDMSDLDEMRKNIKDIKGNLKDLQMLKQSAPSGMASELANPRTGLHGIVRPMLLGQTLLICAFFIPLIAVFHVNDEPIGAWIFGLALVGSPPLFWHLLKGKNEAFNALEDLVDVERALRAGLAAKAREHPPSGEGGEGGLVAAANALRHEVAQQYYDGLAIHCQTGLVSFGLAPEIAKMAEPFYWDERRRDPVV